MITKEEYLENTYMDSKKFIENHENFAIVSAPGTGKSIVLSRIIENYFLNETVILLGPQRTIIDQFYDNYKLYNGENKNIHVQTYSSIDSFFLKSEEFLNSVKLIICDEMHRVGAKTWSKKYEDLLELCPNAMSIGASATPIRQFDGNKNMAEIYFGGNTIGNLTVSKALEYGFYAPNLKYIAVFYKFEAKLKARKEKLEKIQDPEVVKRISSIINNIGIDYTNKNSVKVIMEKHLSSLIDNKLVKILIFAKSENHIKQLSEELNSIFEEIFASRKLSINRYTCKTSIDNFYNFTKAETGVHILYSIDKFSEGIHIPDLDCEIMCRNTQSVRVYLQQLGRILSINGKEDPIIIDLVDNFKNLNFKEIRLLFEANKNASREDKEERANQTPCMYDYVINAIGALEEIDSLIEQNLSPKYQCTEYNFTGTINEIAHHFGINKIELTNRLEAGEDINNIIKYMIMASKMTCFGYEGSLRQICKKFKWSLNIIIYRLNRGDSIEEAIAKNRADFNPADYL